MKYYKFYFGLIVVFIGLTLFGFKLSNTTTSTSGVTQTDRGLTTPFVQIMLHEMQLLPGKEELKFSVNSNYGNYGNINRTITLTNLRTVNTLEDLIEYFPSDRIIAYDAVWIKSMFREENESLMNKSNVLTQDQKALINEFEIGGFISIVINYQSTDAVTKEIQHERMSVDITVVPEREAEFPCGYDELIAYFEENSVALYDSLTLKKFQSVGIKFTISEEGKVEDVYQSRSTGYPEIDEGMIKLVKQLPNWTPAKDAAGNTVKQDFELNYGTPGC